MTRTSKPAAQRRDEILDVAQNLFITKGVQATSVEDILKEVGIAKGTLYYHFSSKEEILRSLISRTTTRAAQQAQSAGDGQAAQSNGSGEGSNSSTPAPSANPGAGTDPDGAKAIARSMMAGHGWGDSEFSCLESLWTRESSWNYQAENASSGAYGIPQALPGSKMSEVADDWATNPTTQITWGLNYISGRYGTPCSAWAHSESVGWY